ncbi:unnamed protein product, partial [Ixodes pacificus]
QLQHASYRDTRDTLAQRLEKPLISSQIWSGLATDLVCRHMIESTRRCSDEKKKKRRYNLRSTKRQPRKRDYKVEREPSALSHYTRSGRPHHKLSRQKGSTHSLNKCFPTTFASVQANPFETRRKRGACLLKETSPENSRKAFYHPGARENTETPQVGCTSLPVWAALLFVALYAWVTPPPSTNKAILLETCA